MPKSADKPFDWRRKGAERAVALCFEGRWTHEEIAKKCGISTRTYEYWLTHPEFQAKLEAKRADFAASIRDEVYADKARRVIGLSQMAEAARKEFEARPWLKEVRPTADGEITNESFNAAAHTAFRAALDDIAKELGERKNVTELSKTQDGRPLRRYRRRWKIERLFAWLGNFRRLVVRYERHALNYLGFVHLGRIVILLQRSL